jgi:hypothetical protein
LVVVVAVGFEIGWIVFEIGKPGGSPQHVR